MLPNMLRIEGRFSQFVVGRRGDIARRNEEIRSSEETIGNDLLLGNAFTRPVQLPLEVVVFGLFVVGRQELEETHPSFYPRPFPFVAGWQWFLRGC